MYVDFIWHNTTKILKHSSNSECNVVISNRTKYSRRSRNTYIYLMHMRAQNVEKLKCSKMLGLVGTGTSQ